MSDSVAGNEQGEAPGWPVRPWIFAGIGLLAGLLIHWFSGGLSNKFGAGQGSAITFIAVTAGLVGFTLERERWWHAIVFSVSFGAIAAGVFYWSGDLAGAGYGANWHYVSLAAAIVIAAPLFQAARDAGARRFDYVSVHDHCWTNLVLWCAAWAFVLICVVLSHLLAGLFDLIKLEFLSDLLREDFYWAILIGGALGAALGLLREQDRIVRTLQRVVLTILAVLAPVLAIGLVLFVVALPMTGLAPLWTSRSAAATLIACVIGAFLLINSVIRNSNAEEHRKPVLRFSAIALGFVMAPLAILAAVAIGLRIGQYGYTPERLWALTFAVLSCAIASAYLVALIRGRGEWASYVRRANLKLAMVICGVALLLATPLLGFNALSTRDQVARLEAGRISPEYFDWRALAFEFGKPGRAALDRLKSSKDQKIADAALKASRATAPYQVMSPRPARDMPRALRILPQGATIPREALAEIHNCAGDRACTAFVVDDNLILTVSDNCFTKVYGCDSVNTVRRVEGRWGGEVAALSAEQSEQLLGARAKAFAEGALEVRNVTRRQLFVGGKPVGQVFE